MAVRIQRAIRLGIVAAALPAALAAQGIRPHVPVSTTIGDIAKVRAAYVDAYNARDAAAVNRIYTTDAVVLGPDGREMSGPEVARRNLDSASVWQAATVRSTSVKVYGTTALDVGTWTTRPAAGDPVVRHYLAVFRHGVEGWKLQALAFDAASQ